MSATNTETAAAGVGHSGRHRVVVVGGGFGGLTAVRVMKRVPVDITLVDRTNHHLFQPLLYQVATGMLSEGTVAPALRDVLRDHPNVEVLLAEVRDFDLEGREVEAVRPDGRTIRFGYDSLVVAAGASSSYFGHDEFSVYAPPMKTIDDALNMRRRIFGAFEMAEVEDDPDERKAWMTFVVVGGGPTGVEVVGQIGELARRTLQKANFGKIDPADARILLYDGGKEILAHFGDQLADLATEALEGLGVEVRTGTRVTGIDAHGVDVEGPDGDERVEARTVVWAAGVQASPLGARLGELVGQPADRSGRVPVEPDCTLKGHPEVFVIGDMMSLENLPGVVEVAMQQGIYVARTIKRRLNGHEPLGPFHYRDLGSIATIGKGKAVMSMRGMRLHGRPAFWAWLVIHLAFLTGMRNRLRAAGSWLSSFVGRSRGERTFTVHSVRSDRIYSPGGDL